MPSKAPSIVYKFASKAKSARISFWEYFYFWRSNLIIWTLVKEIEIATKDTANELVEKALNLLDVELHSKFNNLRRYNDRLEGKKNNDDDNDNNNNGGFVQQQQQQQ